MITHPLPQPEAPIRQPNAENTAHLSSVRVLRHQVAATRTASAVRAAPSPLAFLQLLLGYEWLLAGADKLLLGTFPAQMGGLLQASLSGGHLPGFFATLLRGLVVPSAPFFGVLIEWGEFLAGLGLFSAGLLALLAPLFQRVHVNTVVKVFVAIHALVEKLAPFAAGGAGMLGLSFFLLDGTPLPWFAPGIAYGGSIDTGLFLALGSLILLVSQFTHRYQSRRTERHA